MGKSRFPPWSELPPEILHLIGESTGFPFYRFQFRAVCKSWHSSLAINNRGNLLSLKLPINPLLSSTLPLSIPPNPFTPQGVKVFLVSTTIFVIQPTKGSLKDTPCLLMVDELNPGLLSLRYPLSSSHRRSWDLGNRFLNLLETRVSVLAQVVSYRLQHVRRNTPETGRFGLFEMSSDWNDTSEKAVLLKRPSRDHDDDDLLAMVLFERGRAAILRVRNGNWTIVFDGKRKTSKCCDIVKFKEEIYGIDYQGRAFFIDYDYELDHVNVVNVGPMVEGIDEGEGGKRLVVRTKSTSEELYMVVRKTVSLQLSFLVYKLNKDGQVWDKVKSLGKRMFFVGVDVSFCAMVRDFPGLARSCMRSHPGNCIFFRKGSFSVKGHDGDAGDKLLFGIGKDGTGMNIGQYHLGDECATGLLEPAYDIMFSPPI